MTYVSFILNLPWTIAGLVCGLLSVPKSAKLCSNPKAIVMYVRSFWWYFWHSDHEHIRGMAIGNIVLLGSLELPNDLAHELVHVKQFERAPLIHPFLYQYQNLKHGYKNNKYEREAYEISNSKYIERN